MKGNGQNFIIIGEEFDNAYLYAHKDTDLDGVVDLEDNCPYDYNPSQDNTDGDELGDVCDKCSNSIFDETVVIEGCDSEVLNVLFDDGCTMIDLIYNCSEEIKNNGEFTGCVAKLTNEWKKGELISGREKSAIQRCVTQSNKQ